MFSVAVADVDERHRPGESPGEYVRRLAVQKARAVIGQARPEHVIIGADTTVVLGGTILGKPADMAEATFMLRRLRGRTHQVATGVAALRVRDGRLLTELCVTDVPMRAYTDEEIEAYVASGDPLDKAGAYAIQHPRFQPVASMRGCYASVMGLPLCHLQRLAARLHLHPPQDVPQTCQSNLQYPCPIWQAVLNGETLG